MTKIPSDDILEGLYKLRTRESDQLKTILELYDMEIHQKIPMSNDQKLKKMVREMKQVQRLRVAGDKNVLKEDKENVINGKQKDSVREETSVVSRMMKTSVQIRHQKTLHFSESQEQRGGSASRKKNLRCRSPSAKFARQPCRD